ncbi:MAG: DUF6491 family protein [Thalassotalea sp.]
MKAFIYVILVVLLSACSHKNTLTYEERDNAYRQYINDNSLESSKRINSFRFDGWQSLTRTFLIISTNFKRKYLIEVRQNCNNLAFAQSLVLNQSTGSSLHARLDSISTLSEPNSSCRIQTIYPLTVEQAKEIATIGFPNDDEVAETNADK